MANIRDGEVLQNVETSFTMVRAIEWLDKPLVEDFSYEHFKAIHRHIFQDVYPWAGQERHVGTIKGGHRYYPPGPGLTREAERLFDSLGTDNCLRGLDRQDFVKALAEYWGEINVVHSFREGNTRTQSVFFPQLAEQAEK
ncbi:Fic/DOC family protein [Trueperella sp. LYQ143]|uniref:Fic/DOC family protein n=1 Tax=unclassified Trueperella TaxID=2630174 RepID=UPI003982F21E